MLFIFWVNFRESLLMYAIEKFPCFSSSTFFFVHTKTKPCYTLSKKCTLNLRVNYEKSTPHTLYTHTSTPSDLFETIFRQVWISKRIYILLALAIGLRMFLFFVIVCHVPCYVCHNGILLTISVSVFFILTLSPFLSLVLLALLRIRYFFFLLSRFRQFSWHIFFLFHTMWNVSFVAYDEPSIWNVSIVCRKIVCVCGGVTR